MIDEACAKMHADSKARTYAAWTAPKARALLDAYYVVKDALSTSARTLQTPEEWAGSLLVVHGFMADAKVREAKKRGIRIPKLSRVKKLVGAALDEELACRYPDACCHACERHGPPTMQWRSRPSEESIARVVSQLGRDEHPDFLSEEMIWACPPCARTLAGEPS